MNQAGPVAPADLQKVPHRGREGPGLGLMLPHGPKQPVQPALHGCLSALGVVVQDVCGAMHPAIGHPHRGTTTGSQLWPLTGKEHLMYRMSTLIFILVIGILSMRQSTTAQTTGTSTMTAARTSGGPATTHIVLLDTLGHSASLAFTVNTEPPDGHITQATTIVNSLAPITGSTATQHTDGRGHLTNITITAMGTPIIKAISITPGN